MNLKRKLLREIYPLGAVLIITLALLVALIISINNSAQEIIEQTNPTLSLIDKFLLYLTMNNFLLEGFLKTKKFEDTFFYDQEFHNIDKRNMELMQDMEDLILSHKINNPKLIGFYQQTREMRSMIRSTRDELLALHKEELATGNNLQSEKKKSLDKYSREYNEITIKLSGFIDEINKEKNEAQKNLANRIKIYSLLILFLTIAFLAVLSRRLINISNLIIGPIDQIIESMRDFSGGKYNTRIKENAKISGIRSLQKNLNKVFKAIDKNTRNREIGKTLLKKEFHDILREIEKNSKEKRQTTIKDIKQALGITHPTALSRIKFLEMNGYLKIKKSGREKFLILTEKSKKF